MMNGKPINSTKIQFFPGVNDARGQQDKTHPDPPLQMGSHTEPGSLQRVESKARDQGKQLDARLGSGEGNHGEIIEVANAGLNQKAYKASKATKGSFSNKISSANPIQSPEEED